MRRIRVLLVDDQELVTSSLRAVLELEDDLDVVGEAATVPGALEEVAPDVVVMESHLEGRSTFDAIQKLASATRVLVLSSDEDDESLLAAIGSGASGYLLKRSRVEDVVRAIRETAGGRTVVDPQMAAALLRLPDAHGDPFSGLTQRERLVLEGLATGKTNREIADELHFSERTIKNVVSQTMTKIGAKRRSEAAALFVRHLGEGSASSAHPDVRPGVVRVASAVHG